MMASHNDNSDVFSDYRSFFETFAANVTLNDPLPVKVGSHTIRREELDGEIVDWTVQYLQQKYTSRSLPSNINLPVSHQYNNIVIYLSLLLPYLQKLSFETFSSLS